MPELPEVETTRRGIEPHIVGRRVKLVLVRQPRLRWPVSVELAQALTGQVIESVGRRGKYLLIGTQAGRVMIHLGMSGNLRILPATAVVEKHDHVDFVLEDHTLLRYHDPRRFGSIFWLPQSDGHKLIDNLGPEPLEEDFNPDYLYFESRGKKVAVKLLVMNSHIVVGVGNIYANEALFQSGIRPDRPAGSISRDRYRKLVSAIKNILARAIRSGGTTLKDFVREDGQPGYFSQSLAVYGRAGQACINCQRSLKEARLGQRTTVFCTRCQR
ncbi:MAG: bifunctional DNA-formamidopyrimidine glycosylase/DNA-(apurinic or apyrimidinic site) lyase [bacterium]|nr:bifunctional DNA-formamidopyrimidine glycosylase/DNA-(apurinic or apyrimidinic site) lyase [Gammaproteobacteria bacterium]HIL95408.1 bifunctional DNA-formamidopyrimidine glycosylase/DNA-(apurinic or apyrimidinic site) lyase [Pseudomonadales bacterium]